VSGHERFRFSTVDELTAAMVKAGVRIPLSDDYGILGEPVDIRGTIIPNRLAIQPMEGCDGTSDGRPGDLTLRRYKRFAAGGAGLLWFEATAVLKEARANPRQLFISEDTSGELKSLRSAALDKAERNGSTGGKPFTVLQLTHSGRYSRPVSEPMPIIAIKNPYLFTKFPEAHKILSDQELEELEDIYVRAALMAVDAGFDAVDIKSCHRYLVSELLSAHTREGRYGGEFENRTAFLLHIVEKINSVSSGAVSITPRLNVYDAIPYPYGWGVNTADHHVPDLTEPVRLVRMLAERGVRLVNVTAGNPYYNPHVNRPYDSGPYVPPEHPVAGVGRMLEFAREIKQAVPDMLVMASGFSWLREYGAHAAAGGIREGWFDIAGFGRQAFAYPGFIADILNGNGMDRKKCCIACGKCSEIMRYDGMTGCVIRDREVYAPIYEKVREGKQPLVGKHIAEHV